SRRGESGGAEGDDGEELEELRRAGVVEDDHHRKQRAAEEEELEPVRQRLAVVDDARAGLQEQQPLERAVLHLRVAALRYGRAHAVVVDGQRLSPVSATSVERTGPAWRVMEQSA